MKAPAERRLTVSQSVDVEARAPVYTGCAARERATLPVAAMRRSEPGLDLFRAIAVLLMFEAHVYRLETDVAHGGPGQQLLDLMVYLEPYTAGAFLFIVGFSLVLSQRRFDENQRGVWLGLLLRRGALLYGISVALFIAHYGFELPDLLVSSGILSVIALGIVTVGAMLALPRPITPLAGFAVAVIAVTRVLNVSGATVSGLNAGPGGAFPLLALTAAGAIAGHVYCHGGVRALGWLTLGAVPISALAAPAGPWTTLRASHYAVHAGELALADLFSHPPGTQAVVFWNHSAVGALALLAPLLGSVLLLLATQKVVCRPRAMTPILWLGQHALAAYVAHLGVLGVLDFAGVVPHSAAGAWAMTLALSLGAVALAAGLEARRTLGRKRAAAVTAG